MVEKSHFVSMLEYRARSIISRVVFPVLWRGAARVFGPKLNHFALPRRGQLPHASLINDEYERVRAKTIDRWNLS
jgi:hypothetical protein